MSSERTTKSPNFPGSKLPTLDSKPKEQKCSSGTQATEKRDAFLKLIVDNSEKYQPNLHRNAREKVFESIVKKTLENPDHPYYSLRKELVPVLTEVLTNSHYLKKLPRQV